MVSLKKILVPVNFSETSKKALESARMLADACGASLQLLHVVGYRLTASATEDPERKSLDVQRELESQACKQLEGLLDGTDRDKRHASAICCTGTPFQEIVRHAADNHIDLIVMGTHSHGPTFQMFRGSVAEHVVALAPCAVLTVKSPENSLRETALDCIGAENTSPPRLEPQRPPSSRG